MIELERDDLPALHDEDRSFRAGRSDAHPDRPAAEEEAIAWDELEAPFSWGPLDAA